MDEGIGERTKERADDDMQSKGAHAGILKKTTNILRTTATTHRGSGSPNIAVGIHLASPRSGWLLPLARDKRAQVRFHHLARKFPCTQVANASFIARDRPTARFASMHWA
jgi:hypothetical protein